MRKTLTTSLVNASSGTDRMRAMDDYRRDMAVSDQKAQIEAQTREQLDRAKRSGADEVALNRIEKRSEEMIAALEDQNEIQKAMRDKWMSGLQNAGQKEDVASAWERIQEAAFSRITDPAAEAVNQMDRNEAMRNAQMMNFCKEWFPKIANTNHGLAPD
jgi:predicted double-glycine peptidase